MAMKQIHVNQVSISFCFVPKSYLWRSILGTVVMDQHWKPVMASVHNQRTSSSEIVMTHDKKASGDTAFCSDEYWTSKHKKE